MNCTHELEVAVLTKGEITGWQCRCGKTVTASTADMPERPKTCAPKSRIRVVKSNVGKSRIRGRA